VCNGVQYKEKITNTLVGGHGRAFEINLARAMACLGGGVWVGAATRSVGPLKSLQLGRAQGHWASRASGRTREPRSLGAEERESTYLNEFPIVNLCFCMFASW
jgi:hypothetical protein